MRLGRDDKHIQEARELFEASQESDFYTLIRSYQFARKSNFSVEACRRYGVHAQTARQGEQTFEQIMQIARQPRLLGRGEIWPRKGEGPAVSSPPAAQADPLPRCIMTGFIDQLCLRHDQGTLECDLTEGRRGTD